ncbi:MAG TPA: CPBP family intramembrane glutamic endopeptidase [Gammaproteobacteria bacterium]|jgi:hypothetical protein
MNTMSAEKKSALILAGIAVVEGFWVLLNAIHAPAKLAVFLDLTSGHPGALLGWLCAAATFATFFVLSLRLPSVRENLFKPTFLKFLGLAVAVAAGILEEAVFRKVLMDALLYRGYGPLLQVLASALAFGVAHGVWGLFGRSGRAALGATLATGLLGAMLAVTYLAGGRSVLPCIAVHLLLNALLEPGLVLAACRGEMSRLRRAD